MRKEGKLGKNRNFGTKIWIDDWLFIITTKLQIKQEKDNIKFYRLLTLSWQEVEISGKDRNLGEWLFITTKQQTD